MTLSFSAPVALCCEECGSGKKMIFQLREKLMYVTSFPRNSVNRSMTSVVKFTNLQMFDGQLWLAFEIIENNPPKSGSTIARKPNLFHECVAKEAASRWVVGELLMLTRSKNGAENESTLVLYVLDVVKINARLMAEVVIDFYDRCMKISPWTSVQYVYVLVHTIFIHEKILKLTIFNTPLG